MQCNGQERCTFFKTEKQFNDDNDRAVELCRMRGLCRSCKYRETPCRKRREG